MIKKTNLKWWRSRDTYNTRSC